MVAPDAHGNVDDNIRKHGGPSLAELLVDNELQRANERQKDILWPAKKEAIMEGDLVLGGLMMVHSRDDLQMCGPIMPQGGIQALEVMLYTLDRINSDKRLLPNITIGAHILDDCDRDSYGLEMAVDFIKGKHKTQIIFIRDSDGACTLTHRRYHGCRHRHMLLNEHNTRNPEGVLKLGQ